MLEGLQAGGLYEPFVCTAVYRNELARLVREMSYRTTPARHGFEIEGVNDAVLRRFSKRAHERDKIVSEMEQKLSRKLSNNEVAYAVHQSRTKKSRHLDRPKARTPIGTVVVWKNRARCGHSSPAQTNPRCPFGCEKEALTHAMAHIFERQSVGRSMSCWPLPCRTARRSGFTAIETELRQLPEW